ncbi:MAG: metallophosphoesterase [Acidobacteria bacterium]|nr:metallophosphoesterase [Acidobacteriota bacterium]
MACWRLPHPVLRVIALLALTRVAACGGDSFTSPTPAWPGSAGQTAVLLAAGDIGQCGSAAPQATARLLDGLPGTVITVGDHAYPSGSASDFRDCYDPAWGRHKARTRPSPGNHDYEQPGALPYFTYFGASAGPGSLGYYRYRLGEWQIYSLNSNVPMDAGSAQVQWLRQELAANPSTCALAYWHHPRFTSGPHGDHLAAQPVWRALYEFDAEVVISAHDHLYERFLPQDPDGRPDPQRGLRQFIVGTGGAALAAAGRAHANSDVVWSVYGVLELVLRPGSYTWRFLSETGAPADVGAGLCHEPPVRPGVSGLNW